MLGPHAPPRRAASAPAPFIPESPLRSGFSCTAVPGSLLSEQKCREPYSWHGEEWWAGTWDISGSRAWGRPLGTPPPASCSAWHSQLLDFNFFHEAASSCCLSLSSPPPLDLPLPLPFLHNPFDRFYFVVVVSAQCK